MIAGEREFYSILSVNLVLLSENNTYNVHSIHWPARQAVLILGFRIAQFHHMPTISLNVNSPVKKFKSIVDIKFIQRCRKCR